LGLLYIERRLKAPAMRDDGMLVPRERGTPQGGVISPLLANLFLNYAFDIWLGRGFPGVPFERQRHPRCRPSWPPHQAAYRVSNGEDFLLQLRVSSTHSSVGGTTNLLLRKHLKHIFIRALV
jgi:retron-type reverse transcriptase